MVSVEALYHGNVDRLDAKVAEELIIKAIGKSESIPRSKYPLQHVAVLPKSNETHEVIMPTIDPQEPNTAVEVYFQVGKDNVLDRVLVDVLIQMMYEPLYDELRTKGQFGYHVSCGSRWTFGTIGICFKVVTNRKSANEIASRIDVFLASFKKNWILWAKRLFLRHRGVLQKISWKSSILLRKSATTFGGNYRASL